jgi:hypothetical protein
MKYDPDITAYIMVLTVAIMMATLLLIMALTTDKHDSIYKIGTWVIAGEMISGVLAIFVYHVMVPCKKVKDDAKII